MFCRTFIFAFLAVGALAVRLELTDQYRDSIKTKLTVVCKLAGGDAEQNAQQLTNSLQSFFDCIHPLVDTDTLAKEVETAKTVVNGSVDEVFKKYCAKSSEFKTCFHTLIDAASPCVKESAQNELTMIKNGTDQFMDYVCYNDGTRIGQFLAVNGPQCVFGSKTTEINKCADTLSTELNSLENALSLTVAEKCGRFDQLLTCIFKALETCPTLAPGQMLESLYRYVREGTACNDLLPLQPPAPQ